MTYSIVARDPKSGEFGVAVQSHSFQVGPMVPWGRAGVGAVATQADAEIRYGPMGLDLMAAGYPAGRALAAALAADSKPETRQVAMVDRDTQIAVHTPREVHPRGRPPCGRRLQRPGQHDGEGDRLAGYGRGL